MTGKGRVLGCLGGETEEKTAHWTGMSSGLRGGKWRSGREWREGGVRCLVKCDARAPLWCSAASDFSKWTAIVPINSIECYSLELSRSNLLLSLGLVYPPHLSLPPHLCLSLVSLFWNCLFGFKADFFFMSLLHVSPSSCPFPPQKPLILWTYPQNSLLILILILFCLVLFLTPLSFSNTRLHSVPVCVCDYAYVCTHHWILCLTGAGKRVLSPHLQAPQLCMNIGQGEEGWGHQRSPGFRGPHIRVQGFPSLLWQ